MTANPSGWRPSAPVNEQGEMQTVTGNRGLMLEEPLLFEIGDTETTGVDFDPPRDGEGDHAKHGGGGSPQAPRQIESPLRQSLRDCHLPEASSGRIASVFCRATAAAFRG